MNSLIISTKRFVRLGCIEHLLILASYVTGCVSISAFSSLFGIPAGIASPAVRKKLGNNCSS